MSSGRWISKDLRDSIATLSRYIVALQHLAGTRADGVWGLTELTVWILRQGVRADEGQSRAQHGALQCAMRRRKADPSDQAWLDAWNGISCVRARGSRGVGRPASGALIRILANGTTRPE